MFNATIKAKDYIRVKSKLSHRSVSVSIDQAFTIEGTRFYDIFVEAGERFSKSAARIVKPFEA